MAGRLLLSAVGVLLVAFVAVDQLWTTLAVGTGAGPMSDRVVTGLSRLALRHATQRVRGRVGVPIVMVTVTLWAVLLWVGWTLVFAGSSRAVVSSTTQASASIAERVYFVGYTIMTLGNGGYRPEGTFFELATVAASASGFFVVTLSITYLVPVVSAVVQRRQLASQVTGLGHTAEELVTLSWSDGGFPALPLQFVSLSGDVATVAQQHRAYPVLRVFYSARREVATSPSVAVLSEALILLGHGVAPSCRPPANVLQGLSSAIEEYRRAVPVDVPLPSSAPPAPMLKPLRAAGIPTVSDEEFAGAVHSLAEHRCQLEAMVRTAGWDWAAVRSQGTGGT